MFQFLNTIFKTKNTKCLTCILSFMLVFAQAHEVANADSVDGTIETTATETEMTATEVATEKAAEVATEKAAEVATKEDAQKKEDEMRQNLKDLGLLGDEGTVLSDIHIYSALRKHMPLSGIATIQSKDAVSRALFSSGSKGFFTRTVEQGLIFNGDITLEQSKYVLQAIKTMKIKKISINTQGNLDALSFYQGLADYVSENNIDIHVAGLCANACANYLLPAAKKIIIETYGVIAFQSSFGGVIEDAEFAFENEFDNIRLDFEKGYLSNNMNFSEFFYGLLSQKTTQFLLQFLSDNEIELFHKINIHLESRDAFDLLELSQEDFNGLVDQLTNEDKEKIKQFFMENVYNNGKSAFFTEQLEGLKNIVGLEKETEESYPLPSQYSYTYYELIRRVTKLITDDRFIGTFPYQLKKTYPLPELLKLEYIVPSSQLLKKLGLNIASGENHFQTLEKGIDDRLSSLLYLTEEVLEHCDDFKSSDLRFLNQCLEQ